VSPSEIAIAAVLIVLSYVAGSIPFGVVVARATGAPDPRTMGSGRTGGTNALRSMGRKRALMVVTGDVLKGTIPVIVARILLGSPLVEVLCAAAAVLGSSRSMFVGFKGGRGVGTSVGTMAAVFWPALLVGFPIFIGVILATRYVSLGSLLATAGGGITVVLAVIISGGAVPAIYAAYAVAGVSLVWVAHADNIGRLLSHTERKFDLDLLSRD
jgi:glycerol-3-phosphate acyltransferase PlsY